MRGEKNKVYDPGGVYFAMTDHHFVFPEQKQNNKTHVHHDAYGSEVTTYEIFKTSNGQMSVAVQSSENISPNRMHYESPPQSPCKQPILSLSFYELTPGWVERRGFSVSEWEKYYKEKHSQKKSACSWTAKEREKLYFNLRLWKRPTYRRFLSKLPDYPEAIVCLYTKACKDLSFEKKLIKKGIKRSCSENLLQYIFEELPKAKKELKKREDKRKAVSVKAAADRQEQKEEQKRIQFEQEQITVAQQVQTIFVERTQELEDEATYFYEKAEYEYSKSKDEE